MKILTIFGITASGKTVFQTMLYSILEHSSKYVIEPVPGNSLDYFSELEKALESGEWPAATTQRLEEIKKLEYRVFIKDRKKWITVVTYDINGEDINEYFRKTLTPEKEAKFREFFDPLLKETGLYLFLLDPNPNKVKAIEQDQLFYTILYNYKLKHKTFFTKKFKSPFIFALAKDDIYNIENPKQTFFDLFPLTAKNSELYIKNIL